MPQKTKTGTLKSEIYAGRAIFTLAPPSAPQDDERLEFLVAQRNTMGGEHVGTNVDRQPKGFSVADLKGMTFTAKIGGKNVTFNARELLGAIHETFETIHERAVGNIEPPDAMQPPPAAPRSAKKRK